VSVKERVLRKAIPLCGIVLVLGAIGCDRIKFYSYTAHASTGSMQSSRSAPAEQELVAFVQEFLREVPENKRATFDNFFADDILYTRGTGKLITKKDILADTGNTTAPRANATYGGEDFTVHAYGDTAIVNFRLVMHATENDKPATRTFRNTGTFMKRNGRWQAIAWQATPILEGK
jgi:hypothetical protein